MTLVHSTFADGVATITMDSPHNANALSHRLIGELTTAILEANVHVSTRVIVLTHQGNVFCSGADLTESAAGKTLPVHAIPDLLQAIWECPTPVIARIGGAVRGGGIGLVAATDIAICGTQATFAFSEVRVGVVAASISAVVLPRMSSRKASDLLLTGREFTGIEAQQSGLVTRAVAHTLIDPTVTEYCEAIQLGGPQALAATKKLLNPTVDHNHLVALAELSARHFQSEEAAIGMAARRTKQQAQWPEKAHPYADNPGVDNAQ